mgnify:FL=1
MQLQQGKQVAKSDLLRKCGLLAHTSAAFLKNCCTKKLSFACGSFLTANIKIKKEGFKQMAIQKKGLLIGGIVAVVIAAGGICAAVLPDALHKEESSISNGTVTTTTAAPASTDTENSDQAPETYQSVLSEYYTAFIQNQPDTLYRLMAPSAYWDYYMEHYDKTKEDVISTYQQAITNTMASWKQQCGDDVTVSFAIKGMSEQSQDFLTEWTDDMNEMIGEDQVHAQDAVTLNVERTLTGSKGTQTETISPTLIQVDGFWYILQENTTAADSQQATE